MTPMIRKTLTAQTGKYRFEVELIQAVTVKDDLVYGNFEGYTFEYLDKSVEKYRNVYDNDGRWTSIIMIDTSVPADPTAYVVSVRSNTIVYSRNA